MISSSDQHEGIERLRNLLDDPATLEGVERFVAKLPEINATMELVTNFLASSSRMADNANGIVETAREAMGDCDLYETTERMRRVAKTGTQVAEDLGPALTDPETLASIKALVEMMPRFVALMQIFEQFIAGSSRFADNLNGIISTARKAGGENWIEILGNQELVGLPARLLDLATSSSLNRLLSSQLLSEEAIHVMDQVADATIEAHQHTVETDAQVGRLAAWKALGDPDVQRGLALAIELSRSVGKRVRTQAHAGKAGTA